MTKVIKALSAEEQTVVGNIQSLLSELLSMSGGEGGEAPEAPEAGITEPVTMAMKGHEESETASEEAEEEKAKKDQISTPSKGVTALDGAEKIIDESQTDPSQDNVKEVAKAILTALTPKRIEKSVDPVLKALGDLTQVVGLSIRKSDENAEAIEQILKGLGVADQIETVRKSQGTPITESATNGQLAEFVKTLAGVMKSQPAQAEGISTPGVRISNAQAINKNLSEPNTLAALIGQQFRGR